MVNTSLEYRKALYEDKRSFIPKVNILLSNGTVLELSGSQIMQGGVKIDDGVSSPGSFDIGSAVIGKLTLNINNMQDEYSDYNFTDAIVTVYVGLQMENRIEWLKKGVFNADDPTSTQSIITLECLDNMTKFDKQYDGKLSFPANLQTIVNYCCGKCGVILNTGQFDNYTYRVEKSPFGENPQVTYREILAYCAQIAGCYARCNVDGRLELKWYDTAAFPALDDLDGGNLTDYNSGANIDGGNFTNYSSGDSVDGGEFTRKLPYHHIYSLSSLKIAVDDVVITGIRVTASGKEENGETKEGETVLSGEAGYILELPANPFVEYGKASSVADYLYHKIGGMRFRPADAGCLGDPSIEAGDCAVITDRKGNSYPCYITNLSYTMGGVESLSCDAEPPARKTSQRYSEITKAIVKAREETEKQLSQYDLAAKQLGSLMTNAVGMYETNTVDETDGSVIRYMHDKPELKDSEIIWKQTIDAFAVSTDGGVTWKAGHDKDGNVLATVLTAIGISFDWAKGGTLTLGGKDDTNGLMEIYNEYGKKIMFLDRTGVKFFDYSTEKVVGYITPYDAKFNGSIILGDNSDSYNTRMRYDSYKIEGEDGASVIDIRAIKRGDGSDGPVIELTDRKTNDRTFLSAGGLATDGGIRTGTFRAEKDAHISGKLDVLGEMRVYEATNLFEDLNLFGNLNLSGDLDVSGSKSRVAATRNYRLRRLYCYEMPSPIFGDMGGGVLDDSGICYIHLDDIFSETIQTECTYHVFLQKYGSGDLWVSDLQPLYFVIKGTPGMEFAWEVKAKQLGYNMDRLETYTTQPKEESIDYIAEADNYLYNYEKELLNYE